MVTNDCLGHNKFNWDVSRCFHAQVDIPVENGYKLMDCAHYFMVIDIILAKGKVVHLINVALTGGDCF